MVIRVTKLARRIAAIINLRRVSLLRFARPGAMLRCEMTL
jgi:hypothetical protein